MESLDGGRRRVYSIPVSDLDRFERTPVTVAQHKQLDDFFAQQKKPKVEAARAPDTVGSFDGSADLPPPAHPKPKRPKRKG
jgi:hypothetical protein